MEEILKKTNSSLPVETPVDRVEALQPVDEQQTVHNPYFKLETGLKEIFGEEFELSDSLAQDLLLQHLRVNKEQNARLAGAMQRDPRMAQLLADMIEGKRNAHSAVARYFGRSVMEVDENSPEFDEIMLADEERREEVANLANDRREYEENLAESIPVIEQFCVQKGYCAFNAKCAVCYIYHTKQSITFRQCFCLIASAHFACVLVIICNVYGVCRRYTVIDAKRALHYLISDAPAITLWKMFLV